MGGEVVLAFVLALFASGVSRAGLGEGSGSSCVGSGLSNPTPRLRFPGAVEVVTGVTFPMEAVI